MNIKTKHKLVDLRKEVNVKRDQEITVAKLDYLEATSNARQAMKDTISSIKVTYKQIYVDQKAELIVNMNEKAENEV